jgi:5-methylcytosine-specific restriction protein A
MNRSAETLVERVAEFTRLFDRVSVGGRFDGADSNGPIRLATSPEVLQASVEASRLRRLMEVEQVKLAGEIAARSDRFSEDSLAARMGASGPSDLVAQVTGLPREQAGTMVRLAEAIRPRESLTGEPLPPLRPHLADAFGAGRLDLTVAAALARTLRKVAPAISADELLALEEQLVERTQEGFTADQLLEYLRQVPDFADPDGIGQRFDDQVARASVTKRRLDDGLTRWVLDLDALTNGLFETALDANTAIKRFRITMGDDAGHHGDDDRRLLAQRRVDGLARVAKRAIKEDDGHVAGAAVTLLVTMTEEALRTGLGAATLLGCDQSIPASIARMLAAEAEIIPVVLGAKSQTLDLGQGRRFFSEAQRRAMALRDKGCAGPCCDNPLSWCDAAHINPAGYGPTAVENGILLCWRCHLLLDRYGWQVVRDSGRWWWTPPPWIDPTGTRRPGGAVPLLID